MSENSYTVAILKNPHELTKNLNTDEIPNCQMSMLQPLSIASFKSLLA